MLLLITLFVVVAFFVFLTVKPPRNGSPLIFLMRTLETLGILGLTAVRWPGSVQTFLSVVSLVNFNPGAKKAKALCGPPLLPAA